MANDWDQRSVNYFVVSESGKILAIDYGYHEVRGLLSAGYSKPYRRRALLHSLDALKHTVGIDRVDVALISHFHDDHVCGVPLLQRLHGTQCWATEAFADLLAQPANMHARAIAPPIHIDLHSPTATLPAGRNTNFASRR